MVKKFTVNCNFKNGSNHPVTFFIGDPAIDSHPLSFQGKWLSEMKGGAIPKDILDSFAELKKIADQNHIAFEELCTYVIDEINARQQINHERDKAAIAIEQTSQQILEIPTENKADNEQ